MNLNPLERFIKYLWYLLKHKWFVMIECFKVGLCWQGIIHDWSKFLPSEFFPYARHDFKRSKTGYYKPTDTGDKAFDLAWFLHQKRNKHHWQWWVLPETEEKGKLKVLEIPHKYCLEMLCDWRGAGRAQGTPNVKEWWRVNRHKLLLHPKTEKWLEERLV